VNILYGIFSSYGNSALRPIVWLGGLYIFTTLMFFITDGAALGPDFYQFGWLEHLYNDRCLKAATISAKIIFNPLSLFTRDNYLIPETITLVVISSILKLFSTLFYALAILAFRKRFKMSI